jgi:hypothetical protein
LDGISFNLDEQQKKTIEHEIQALIGEAVNTFSSKYSLEFPYMKKRELELYLHLSNNTIDKLLRAGLPRICVQGITIYSKRQVDEWLERHKVRK